MRLPLLVAGNVRSMIQFATVRLPLGKWKIVFENHKDSVLSVTHGQIVQGGNLCIMFVTKGTEPNLNIFAELQK